MQLIKYKVFEDITNLPYKLALVSTVIIIVSSAVFAQNNYDALFNKAKKSVVKVETKDTKNVGSGFIWKFSNNVITALHVVDKSKNIQVYYPGAGIKRSASVDKVLKEADLVMLKIENAPNLDPLPVSTKAPQTNDELFALGYPLNVSSVSSISLKVRFGGKTLREMTPPSVTKKLKDNGYPNVDLEIINFEGNLVPGISGAPIINTSGDVVAVADGGLESGAIGISWGLPFKNLNDVFNSSVTSLPDSRGTRELFAADLEVDYGRTIETGDMKLTKVRTRSFLQIAGSADDQLGLVQLSSVLGFDQPSFMYDIYQDINSGATVVIPQGADIEYSGNDWIISKNDNSRFEMILRMQKGDSEEHVQRLSLEFENYVGKSAQNYRWEIDPSFSYFIPQFRFDGMVVNRKAAYGLEYNYNTMLWNYDKYLFETLATRNNILIAYAVRNNDNTPETINKEALCAQGFYYPYCDQLFADRRLWAQMVLAVHLTSFAL